MSINSDMKPYLLYVNCPTRDEYGGLQDHYVFVREVMVALYFRSVNRRDGDIRYQECDYSGVTRYKGLDLKKKYKLIPKGRQDIEYLIESINELTRLCQYLLRAVVCSE